MARTDLELNQVAAESESRFESPMLVLTADVTKEEEVESAISEAVKKMGGIDLLVNNAGGARFGSPPFSRECTPNHIVHTKHTENVVACT